MNEHLLVCTLTPSEYAAITESVEFPAPVYTTYWENIPEYLIAQCPLCNATYTAQLDTYSLKYWVRPEHGESIFAEYAQKIGCNHFVRTHHFINLNGWMPKLDHQKTLGSEVPYVYPFWLPNDVKSYAVMHALPICIVEEEKFVPRYSLYVITYYSEDRKEMLSRRWKAVKAWATLVTPVAFPDQQEEIFDLNKWVKAGKLWWLDPGDPDLPLKRSSVETFPYAGIQGSKRLRVFYRDGQVGTYPV